MLAPKLRCANSIIRSSCSWPGRGMPIWPLCSRRAMLKMFSRAKSFVSSSRVLIVWQHLGWLPRRHIGKFTSMQHKLTHTMQTSMDLAPDLIEQMTASRYVFIGFQSIADNWLCNPAIVTGEFGGLGVMCDLMSTLRTSSVALIHHITRVATYLLRLPH